METWDTDGNAKPSASTRSCLLSGKSPSIAALHRSRNDSPDGRSLRPSSPWKNPP